MFLPFVESAIACTLLYIFLPLFLNLEEQEKLISKAKLPKPGLGMWGIIEENEGEVRY